MCLTLLKEVYTKIMFCLIIVSKYKDLCLFWGYVQMYSGQHVVIIDFQLLGLESDRKEGRDSADEILNFNLLHFHNINNLLLISIKPNIRNKYTDHIIS